MNQGRYRVAEALCGRALDIFEKTVAPDHPQLVEVLEEYAGILYCAGMLQEDGHPWRLRGRGRSGANRRRMTCKKRIQFIYQRPPMNPVHGQQSKGE